MLTLSSDADASPLGMLLNISTYTSDCVGLQCNCLYQYLICYSCYAQYLSKKFSKPTGARTDGSDANAKPPDMLLNIPTCTSYCVGLQCNCLYQYLSYM